MSDIYRLVYPMFKLEVGNTARQPVLGFYPATERGGGLCFSKKAVEQWMKHTLEEKTLALTPPPSKDTQDGAGDFLTTLNTVVLADVVASLTDIEFTTTESGRIQCTAVVQRLNEHIPFSKYCILFMVGVWTNARELKNPPAHDVLPPRITSFGFNQLWKNKPSHNDVGATYTIGNDDAAPERDVFEHAVQDVLNQCLKVSGEIPHEGYFEIVQSKTYRINFSDINGEVLQGLQKMHDAGELCYEDMVNLK